MPLLILYIKFVKKKRQKILWGPIPMINYKYWSNAMKNAGYDSVTLVNGVYDIYDKSDFDLYYEDIVPLFLRFNQSICLLYVFLYSIKNAKLINISFNGGYLGNTPLWRMEMFLYKLSGIKVVVAAYGGDFYQYSKIIDPSVKHVLLMSYPEMAKQESLIEKKVRYWTKNADAIVNGVQIDGIGRWSCLPVNALAIANDKITEQKRETDNDTITIVHSPNHRGFKGTEFIINAIEGLKAEGYKINFILLEKVPNSEVLRILREEADILVEQIIFSGYALNAIEGMANGVPVLSNLSNETYLQLFRRYSYLHECPILSTTPETIKENLRLLIENPSLRNELGMLGIQYIKKYHSEDAAQYMFGKIYNQLLNDVDEDLINMFHPLKSEYCQKEKINTPLTENIYLG